jgi:hypothetical protein
MATPFASGLYPPFFGLGKLDIEWLSLENGSRKNTLFLFKRDLNLFHKGV